MDNGWESVVASEFERVDGIAMYNDGTWNVGDKVSGEYEGKPFSGVVKNLNSKYVFITLDSPIAFLVTTDKPEYEVVSSFRCKKVGE